MGSFRENLLHANQVERQSNRVDSSNRLVTAGLEKQ